MLLLVLILVAFGIGIIAGLMAYVIHYKEYQHHFRGSRPARESFKSALVTFSFFFLLSIAIAIILHQLFK